MSFEWADIKDLKSPGQCNSVFEVKVILILGIQEELWTQPSKEYRVSGLEGFRTVMIEQGQWSLTGQACKSLGHEQYLIPIGLGQGTCVAVK